MRLPQNAPSKKSFQVPRSVVLMLVAIIAVLFVVVLWFVYPKSHMHKDETGYGAKPDEVAIIYLRHEVEAKPGDMSLRLRLVHQELQLGNVKQAEELLKQVRQRKLPQQQRAQLQWYAFQVQFAKATADDTKQSVSREQVKHLSRALTELLNVPLTTKQMMTLTRQAVELKAYSAVQYLLKKLVLRRQRLSVQQLMDMGRFGFLAADFLRSAECYMAAFNTAKDMPDKKRAYLLAVKSLLAGNLVPKHLALVKRDSALFKDDPEVLVALAKAALAGQQNALASRWMKQAMGLHYTTPSKGG